MARVLVTVASSNLTSGDTAAPRRCNMRCVSCYGDKTNAAGDGKCKRCDGTGVDPLSTPLPVQMPDLLVQLAPDVLAAYRLMIGAMIGVVHDLNKQADMEEARVRAEGWDLVPPSQGASLLWRAEQLRLAAHVIKDEADYHHAIYKEQCE
jgi:hypothetical protein